jgi:hypothetical protein
MTWLTRASSTASSVLMTTMSASTASLEARFPGHPGGPTYNPSRWRRRPRTGNQVVHTAHGVEGLQHGRFHAGGDLVGRAFPPATGLRQSLSSSHAATFENARVTVSSTTESSGIVVGQRILATAKAGTG